jgi:hypothetical protein
MSGRLGQGYRESDWENLGGQLVPNAKVKALLALAREGGLPTWNEMHAGYLRFAAEYSLDKARHAWATLAWMAGKKPAALDEAGLRSAIEGYSQLCDKVAEDVWKSRKKDHDNHFRKATYRSQGEQDAVVGTAERNPFVLKTRKDMAILKEKAAALLAAL